VLFITFKQSVCLQLDAKKLVFVGKQEVLQRDSEGTHLAQHWSMSQKLVAADAVHSTANSCCLVTLAAFRQFPAVQKATSATSGYVPTACVNTNPCMQ